MFALYFFGSRIPYLSNIYPLFIGLLCLLVSILRGWILPKFPPSKAHNYFTYATLVVIAIGGAFSVNGNLLKGIFLAALLISLISSAQHDIKIWREKRL